MSLSIRWRLTLWIVVALVATLAAIFFTLSFALRQSLASDIDDDLARDADHIATLLLIEGSLNDPVALQDLVGRYSVGGLESGFVVLVRDPQGNVVAATPGLRPEDFSLSGRELERLRTGQTVSRNVRISGGEEVRARSATIAVGGSPLGIVEVGESTELISRTLDRLRTLFIAVGSAAVLVTFAVGYWLSRRTLRPIEDVAAVAARIEASDLTQRIGARGQPLEVQRLSDTFDSMLARLDRAFQQQRNFVLDVAHELRTPLTALSGNIDVLLMREDLDEQTRQQLERMSGETARLIRLTTNLLYLAMADAGRELDRRPVELDVLCLDVCRLMRDLRPEVKLRLGNEDQVTVTGDRDLLKQMLLNLVENGMKYTPAGGTVTLSLYLDESRARIVVEDTGRGLSPEELSRVFQRFYRGGDSGKRGSAGAGIGLAIVDWIVRAHGGEIGVESEVGKGSRFTVLLPMQGPPSAADGGAPAQGQPSAVDAASA
ncbi:MAG TPA: ATP-binding protein [Dehalococcoidia bacterium]|nr:ATP-binding protein [Dehalococcoidia bacterium]